MSSSPLTSYSFIFITICNVCGHILTGLWQLIISQWMNHSGKACRRNGFTHDRSSLHCDRWVSTYIGLKKKKKDQITTSTCSVASCGAAQYPHHWSVHWGEIYWIFFYPKPAVAFAGNKVTNSVFLPTVAPHGIRTPFHIDYIWRHSTCMSVKLGHTHTHTYTQPLIRLVVDPRPPCMSQKLYALYDHFLILLALD